MKENFELRNTHPYNLRQNSKLLRNLVKSVHNGTESNFYLVPKIVFDDLKRLLKMET